MLHLMRKYAGSWLIKIILGSIVVVFVFWGIGSFQARKAGRVALVNREPVSVEEYRQSYNTIIERLRASFGNEVNEEMIERFQVKEQALNQLIDQKLLLQEAKRVNFSVSNEELTNTIKKMASFQSSGSFDSRLYKRLLNVNRLTPEEFEEIQKRSMLIQKLQRFVQDAIHVSDEEVNTLYRWRTAEVNINYVTFEPANYKEIHPSAEEIKTFFEQNKTSYKTDELRKVRYLRFDPEKYRDKVKIPDEAVKEYYDANPGEFNNPKTVTVRHILIKIEPDAGPETVEEKREKALEILKMARGKKDFAVLAKTYSEDPNKEMGGLLGPFERDAMVKPFSEAAFSMKAGEVSEPVRTQFGWHIIKVEKVNEASILSLKEADARIRKKITDEKARSFAYDQAEAVYDLLIDGADLDKTAGEHHIDILATDFFSKKGPVGGVAQSEPFIAAAFKLAPMEISDSYHFVDGYYILQVLEKIPQKIPEFAAVQEKVKADLIEKKQDGKAKEDAGTFLEALKSGKTMEEEGKQRQLKVTNSGFIKRNDGIPNLGYEPEISNVAFSLSSVKKIAQTPVKGKKGYYAIELSERKNQDGSYATAEKEQIRELLLQQKRMVAFNSYLAQLKTKSDIQVEEDFSTKGTRPAQTDSGN
ncbi:MAG: SurA N-terminal domain-containing protein [Pseudomonadota bacterium]